MRYRSEKPHPSYIDCQDTYGRLQSESQLHPLALHSTFSSCSFHFGTISNIWPFFSFPLSFFLRAQIIVLMSISACMMIWQLTFKKICLITPYLQTSRRSGSNLCLSVAQSCPTLCNPMCCSPLGSSLHGILQARYWSGLPFPSPGIFSTQGLNPGLLHCRQILNHLSHQEKPWEPTAGS